MDLELDEFLRKFEMPNYLDYGKQGIIQGNKVILYESDALVDDNSEDDDKYYITDLSTAFPGIDVSGATGEEFYHVFQEIDGVPSVVFSNEISRWIIRR